LLHYGFAPRIPPLRSDQSLRHSPPVLSLVDEVTIQEAEDEMGLRLPSLLHEAYREIGNGGFGPGYGLLALVPDRASAGETVVGLYRSFRGVDPEDPAWSWPIGLVPFCDWGCAIRSCVDCSSSEGRVVTFDPNPRGVGDDMAVSLAPTHDSLDAWFSDWIAGVNIWDVMFEPDANRERTMINPLTPESMPIVPLKLRR
jgi:hypothetical protein